MIRTRAVCALTIGALALASPLAAQQGSATRTKVKAPAAAAPDTAKPKAAQPDTTHHFSGVIGVAIDSLHGDKLVGAVVAVIGTERKGITDATGQFRIDSVPPGEYRLSLSSAVLDTVGLAVATQPIAMPVGRYAVVRLTTPSRTAVLNMYCPKEKLVLGPGGVVGRVLNADTDVPDSGAHVMMSWTQLEVSAAVGVKRTLRRRDAHADANGMFAICGVPVNINAALSASLNKEETADVPIKPDGDVLSLTMLHVANPDTSTPPPAQVTATSNTPNTPAAPLGRRGRAVLTGRVTDLQGRVLPGVSLGVLNAASTATSNADGSFTLRGLPAGTQALVARHLGYALTHVTVDLSSVTPRTVEVKMPPAPPQLAAVTIVGKRDKGLRDVGFTTRMRAGIGHYLTEEQIAERQPMQMTDLLTQMPGIRMDYSSGYPVPTASRDAMGGCVSYVIDGVPQQFGLETQDFNDYMHPDEVSAMEVYSPSEAPAQFQVGGNSSCEVIVIWTKTKIGG